MAQLSKHSAYERHLQAAAYHTAAAHHAREAASHHELDQLEEAKRHAAEAHKQSVLAHRLTTFAYGHSYK
jgi:hypothetical protein